MGHIQHTPSSEARPQFKSGKKARDGRRRWQTEEFAILLSHHAFIEAEECLRWASYLMIYHALRPSEACQLRITDICEQEGIPYIQITDEGDGQRVKNLHATRPVPIHEKVIALGFLEYVAQRRQSKQIQLFDYSPQGMNRDWSRRYRSQLGRVLSQAGFLAGDRPTAYGFRHSFIDTLKQQGFEESLVAEIVGHTHPTMTFGRYGKRSGLNTLKNAVNRFNIEGGSRYA